MNDFELFEKAKSKSQQRLMGAVHAYQKYGTVPKNKDFAAMVIGIAKGGKKKKRGKGKTKGMKKSSATEYAETKHKDLPEKVSESFAEFVEHVGDDWVHRSYEERIGRAQQDANKFRKKLGRGLLKKVRSLGPQRRHEPTSWRHDVKRRAFRTVSDAVKRRFGESKTPEVRNVEYKNLDEMAQAVWNESNVGQKKAILHEMVNSFKFKAKQEEFHKKIDRTNRIQDLDYLASNITLADIASHKVR